MPQHDPKKNKKNSSQISSDALILNKNPQNPLSALEALLLVQIGNKTCL